MEYGPICGDCKRMYAERNPPGEAPCQSCRVETVEENEDAIRIFFLTQYQVIMGPRGPVDINHLAVHAAMELYGIIDRRRCFEKVLKLSRWWLENIKDGNDES